MPTVTDISFVNVEGSTVKMTIPLKNMMLFMAPEASKELRIGYSTREAFITIPEGKNVYEQLRDVLGMRAI